MRSRDRLNQSQHDQSQFRAIADLFMDDVGIDYSNTRSCAPGDTAIDLIEAIEAFPRYITKACLSKFLARVEIFRTHVLPIHGDIIECGVLHGASLFTWAKLSSIFEPVNHTRRVWGFDTFEGFKEFHPEHDKQSEPHFKPGDLRGLSLDRMKAAIDVYDLNRPLAHIEKVSLVQGDLVETAGKWVKENPHATIAMLNLDVDLYKPTLAALEAFVPLMPKGAVIIFDEANYSRFPGESVAAKEYFKHGFNSLRLQRFSYTSMVSFAVLE